MRMSRQRTLAWLADLQADLTAVVRTPLEAREGALRTNPARYPDRACARIVRSPQLTAAERLAVYNRQYWLRSLRAMQEALPLTCRLIGAWHFNALATRFLLAHPPHAHDLGAIGDRFDQFLERVLREDVRLGPGESARRVPRDAVSQAAQIDLGFRRCFVAPPEAAFRADAAPPPDARLTFSRAFTLIREGWPLVQLREHALGADAEKPVHLPEQLAAPQRWALFRTPRGTGTLRLEPQHALLLELLQRETLSRALERLEADCPRAQRSALPAKVQAWFSISARLGFFTSSSHE